MKVKPCNRHLLVEEATKEEKKKSTFILPEEFKVNKDPYKIVKVLSCADDCEKIKQEGIHIVVPSNMIEILDDAPQDSDTSTKPVRSLGKVFDEVESQIGNHDGDEM